MDDIKIFQNLNSIDEYDKDKDKEFFYTSVNENYILKEKIKDLQCLVQSLKSEIEKLIDENIRLIDDKKSKS